MNKTEMKKILSEDINDNMADRIYRKLSANFTVKEFKAVLYQHGYQLKDREILPIIKK